MSPIEQVDLEVFRQHNLQVFIKRDDLLHPVISGNKIRKLKYNVIAAKEQGYKQILSFGGAYSNHLHALSYACKINNLTSIAIVRGEPQYGQNFTLSWAQHWGMKLNFVDRKTYKRRSDPEFLAALAKQYPQAFIIPEGGSNALALPGVQEIITELDQQVKYDYLFAPVGSGGTLAGLILADNNRHKICGIAVLKQHDYLELEVQRLLGVENNSPKQWKIFNEFHGGGYGKYSPQDADAIVRLNQQTNIPFEPVYSGKMMLALLNLVKQGYFESGSTIMLLHTGGMQGLGGMAERGLIDAKQWPVPPWPPTN